MGPVVRDSDCVRFLQWCLPRLGLRWPGYRKVRRTVCKRLRRRLRALDLEDLAAYRAHLERDGPEWQRLDALCSIPISRFYRDRGVFEVLGARVLPDLAESAAERGTERLRAWCAGCASGEEVYSLRLVWDLAVQSGYPEIDLHILGTDAEPVMLQRAKAACYPAGSLKELPATWRERAFAEEDGLFRLRPAFRHDITLRRQDIRRRRPKGPFDLILCRNLVFTYFAQPLQVKLLGALRARLGPRGVLVVGAHEDLPNGGLERIAPGLPVYRQVPAVKK